MKTRTPHSLLVFAALVATPFLLNAQDQPAVADNRQDEIVTIDASSETTPDSFKILRSGDKQEINRYVTKVYPLENANPFEILPYLRTIATLERGNVITAWVPKPSEKAKSWIQVNVPEFQLQYIDEAVAAYDVPDFSSIPGDVKFSYRTKYRSAVEVADFIRSTTLSPDGLIRGDSDTNTIYVQDSPSDFRRVLAQIEFYDIPSPQIDVEVSIIELTDIDQTSLGLDWDAWKTALSGGATIISKDSRVSPDTGGVMESNSFDFEGILSVDATAAARFLNYLVDEGKAEVLTRTNLTVRTNTPSSLTSGIGVPSYTYEYEGGKARCVLTNQEGAGDSEGFSLSLFPTIAMNAALIDVAFLLRSPVAIDKSGDPIFSDQELFAQLTLEQNQLYRLGGVRRGIDTVERKGFPLLKEIPVIKYLFSNESRIIRDSEVYVFLKPVWTAPKLPASDSMKVDSPAHTPLIAEILMENPNLAMSSEDAALLDLYFTQKN